MNRSLFSRYVYSNSWFNKCCDPLIQLNGQILLIYILQVSLVGGSMESWTNFLRHRETPEAAQSGTGKQSKPSLTPRIQEH